MYDVVVDIDGVLIDIHEILKRRFARMGMLYDVKNVLTYDFNKSLADGCFDKYLPARSLIYKQFEDPELYKQAPYDWDNIVAIRQHAQAGTTFLIYTLSVNMKTQLAKQALFSHWFLDTPNVSFLSVIPLEYGYKKGICCRAVVEDCHINLRDYGADTFKYLVDKPYNQEQYNSDYADVFSDPCFNRCSDTYQAIELAAAKAEQLKHKVGIEIV